MAQSSGCFRSNLVECRGYWQTKKPTKLQQSKAMISASMLLRASVFLGLHLSLLAAILALA